MAPPTKIATHDRLFDSWVEEPNLRRLVQKTSFTIRITKLMAIIVAVALLAVVVVWPILTQDKNKFSLTFSELETTLESMPPVMLSPRFHGVDENSQPYNVTANRAIQEDDNNVSLQKVEGDIGLDSGGWLSIRSDGGHINTLDKKLDLSGAVTIYSDTGYEFSTETAHFVLEEGKAFGNEPVLIQGPLGVLRAKGFVIEEKGDKIHFKGRVSLTIYPNQS